MTDYLIECCALLVRWLHVVAAIAWIGESFYFVALDRGLKPAAQPQQGLAGESWSVHGGGFYHKQKYLPAPAELPEVLHWSKWKSYTTWLSGLALFTLLYLLSPSIYLIDPAVAEWTSVQAIALALGFLAAAWFAYDALCRICGQRDNLLGVAVALLVLGLCFVATHLFAGRAAFILVGAALGTIMSANVFFVIIPGQKRMVAALQNQQPPNPIDGIRGKQRSVHNTYITLPVVFAMLSNHYATAFAHEHSWLVLGLFMAAGAAIRQFFVLWHSGDRAWGYLLAGGILLAGTFAWLAPSPRVVTASVVSSETRDDPAVEAIAVSSATEATTPAIAAVLQQRCSACHSSTPTLMASAPKGAMFDDITEIERNAALIHRQTVTLRIMPPGNLTHMTEAERELISRWFDGRAGVTAGDDASSMEQSVP